MAWTAPATWSTDQIVMASGSGSLNEQLRDNLLALDQHAHTGAAGDGSSTLTGVSFSNVAGYQFADQSADPTVTGTIQRNGFNILYYDGSTAIDLTASDNNSIVSIVVGGFVGNNQFGSSSYETVDVTLKLYIGGVLQQTITGYSTGALWPTGYGEVQSLRRNFIGSTGGTVVRVTSQVEGGGWTTGLGYIRGRKSVYENVITV